MTVIQAKEWVFEELVKAKSSGEITINGEIYIDKKPTIDLEDIVINSITADNEYFQTVLLNVNCYVPDMKIKAGNDMYMPNRARLKSISNQVKSVINDVTNPQMYRFYVEQIQQEEEPTEKSNFINFRVRVNILNNK